MKVRRCEFVNFSSFSRSWNIDQEHLSSKFKNSISLRKLNGIRKVKTKPDLPRVISSRMAWNPHIYHCTHFQVQEEKMIVKKTTQSQKLTGEDLSSGYKNTASPYPRDSHLTRNVTLAIPALSIALAFISLALIDKIDGSWNLFALFLTRKCLVCTEEYGKWYWLNDMGYCVVPTKTAEVCNFCNVSSTITQYSVVGTKGCHCCTQ